MFKKGVRVILTKPDRITKENGEYKLGQEYTINYADYIEKMMLIEGGDHGLYFSEVEISPVMDTPLYNAMKELDSDE